MGLSIVKQLEGKSDRERTKIVEQLLMRNDISYKKEYFRQGTNIIVTKKGKIKKSILAVCHTDAFPGSPGANDDASAIAVLIGVLQKLKRYRPQHTIQIIFFDQEEAGCLGSRAYIKRHGVQDIGAVLDLELVGRGDVVGIWPVTTEVEKSKLLEVVHTVCKKEKFAYEDAKKVPLFFGDYRSFHEAGFYEALCLTLVPKEERRAVRAFSTSPSFFGLGMAVVGKLPTFFKHYHSPSDTSDYLREKDLKKMAVLVYNILKELDLISTSTYP